jgi:hypothetical protein
LYDAHALIRPAAQPVRDRLERGFSETCGRKELFLKATADGRERRGVKVQRLGLRAEGEVAGGSLLSDLVVDVQPEEFLVLRDDARELDPLPDSLLDS